MRIGPGLVRNQGHPVISTKLKNKTKLKPVKEATNCCILYATEKPYSGLL